jgi:hypothetical protein
MFVNVSPVDFNMEETVTTLVYGTRAKMITNDAQKNVESRQMRIMNEAYKKMQSQLDLALGALRTNNIALPAELGEAAEPEPVPTITLEEAKEPTIDIANLPEFRPNALDTSRAPSENA